MFPHARGGDLADFLRKPRPPEFESDGTLIIALAKLASAVEEVHNFSANAIDLKLIGCHHDLKPRNILVDGPNFILADFGLSRLKSISETSNTLFRRGQGDYLAPECEDVDGSFEKHSIRRSSDIWSFGCILAEVWTYMILGLEGVAEFKKRRRYKVGNFIYYHFHHGPNRPSPGVAVWLSDLAISGTRMQVQLLSLIRAMLSLNVGKRPRANEVTARLRMIGLDFLAQSISTDYENLANRNHSIEALIEQARFESWRWACGFHDADTDPALSTPRVQTDFQSTVDALHQMQEVLGNVLGTEQNVAKSMLLPLRHLNNRIRDLLPMSTQHEMQSLLEHSLIQSQDMKILSETQHAFEDRSSGGKFAMLARIRLMTVLAMERSDLQMDLKIDPQHLEYSEHHADFDVAVMKDGQSGLRCQVLIEWMQYDSLVDEQKGRERLIRVEAIAELLNSAEKPEDFRVLHCAGFFHDKDNYRYGLVFRFPSPSTSEVEERKAITLGYIINTDKSHKKRLPVLEDRFKLAHALTVSIIEFHKVRWLHKAISPFHVVFFPPKHSPVTDYVAQPYITGFNYSRPDEPSAFTEGPGEGSDHKDYQHPEYLRNRSRYRPEFDYYSVGIVLLEIGLWTSLANLTVNGRDGQKYRTLSPEEFLERLLKKTVPLLRQTMGTRYFEVVKHCLTGKMACSHEVVDSMEASATLHLNFERLVVEELARCLV